jgi:tripartite-type tricarboxylate transporter receptor subunit TctC
MHSEIERAVAKPELAAKLKGYGLDVETMSPALFDQMLKAEVETNAHLVSAAGLGLKK